jgi:TetR/AcrR family transcriptional repressor of nem operon
MDDADQRGAVAIRHGEEQSDTRSAILDIAERLVQSRGFNGFSYADVAGELGITKAALHYHFPGKAELGEALIVGYAARFLESLEAIDHRVTAAVDKLRAYADLYLEVLSHGRMCLCGMLAAEYETLPDPMRHSVVRFFDDNSAWLATLLEAGRAQGSLVFPGQADDAAQLMIGALEGAMLVGRPYGGTARFEAVTSRLIAEFAAPGPPLSPTRVAAPQDR